MDAFGGYPTLNPPYGQAPGSYVVAPSLPGSGGVYSYVQQNVAGVGSPNAYYSRNYFTNTPMTGGPTSYYGSGYAGYNPYAYGGAPTYSAPGQTAYYNYPTYTYGRSSNRQSGPLRRLFGGRR